jgi:predicted RNA binding protein YcfA (HicA-like mRNA interferase family)
MAMSASSQMKEARRQLGRRGFSVTKTRGGHWRFEHPDMDGPVFAPDTPSDHRGIKNLHAMLRRKMRSSIP